MKFKVLAMPQEKANYYWQGGVDASGLLPERTVSDGPGNPCRHCLGNIDEGEEKLVLSYKPFESTQPYAESGPIFLHGKPCKRYPESEVLPAMFQRWTHVLARGYDIEDRICYGTGTVTPVNQISDVCQNLLEKPEVAYIHIRSAQYNCYQCRVERA